MPSHTYSGTTREDFIRFEGPDHFITMEDEARLGLLDITHTRSDSDPTGVAVDVHILDSARIDLLRVANLDLYLDMFDTGRARMIQHSGGLAEIHGASKYIAFIETWNSDTIITTGGGVGFVSLGSESGGFKHKITTNG